METISTAMRATSDIRWSIVTPVNSPQSPQNEKRSVPFTNFRTLIEAFGDELSKRDCSSHDTFGPKGVRAVALIPNFCNVRLRINILPEP
jgi:hypothetical protein